jgi:hypothetical protein
VRDAALIRLTFAEEHPWLPPDGQTEHPQQRQLVQYASQKKIIRLPETSFA